jgi:hypothetical protein
MKITDHQISVIKSFCAWAKAAINNSRMFDGSFQLDQTGHAVLINQGRYRLRFLESKQIQVESLVAPWKQATQGSYLLLPLLLEVLNWSVEDYFALTYQHNEDQSEATTENTQGDAKAEGMGPDHTGKKSQAG